MLNDRGRFAAEWASPMESHMKHTMRCAGTFALLGASFVKPAQAEPFSLRRLDSVLGTPTLEAPIPPMLEISKVPVYRLLPDGHVEIIAMVVPCTDVSDKLAIFHILLRDGHVALVGITQQAQQSAKQHGHDACWWESWAVEGLGGIGGAALGGFICGGAGNAGLAACGSLGVWLGSLPGTLWRDAGCPPPWGEGPTPTCTSPCQPGQGAWYDFGCCSGYKFDVPPYTNPYRDQKEYNKNYFIDPWLFGVGNGIGSGGDVSRGEARIGSNNPTDIWSGSTFGSFEPDGSYLSHVYASETDRRNKRGGIKVRVIDYCVEGHRRGRAAVSPCHHHS